MSSPATSSSSSSSSSIPASASSLPSSSSSTSSSSSSTSSIVDDRERELDAISESLASISIQQIDTVSVSSSTAVGVTTSTFKSWSASSVTSIAITSPSLSPSPSSSSSSSTGVVYDRRFLAHCANYAHVETPTRAAASMALLVSRGVFERCVHVQARLATDEELTGMNLGGSIINVHALTHLHTPAHVARIDATATHAYGPDEPDSEVDDAIDGGVVYPDCIALDPDTFANRSSSLASRLAVGGLIDLMFAVASGELKNGFAVIRPPGHHADSGAAQGFCLYNNVAVAVHALQTKHPETMKKVLIVDFDVHHGNGTQNMFYDNPNVLYFSIHRYQNAAFYPHTGAHTECGGAGARGSNVNVPLNAKGYGDAEYETIFDELLLPIIVDFQPAMIVVSAGFDCASGDPLGGMCVSTGGFGRLTRKLVQATSHGRVVMALEGGYNIRSVSEAVVACTKSLLGDEPSDAAAEDDDGDMFASSASTVARRTKSFRDDFDKCVDVQRQYFASLPVMRRQPEEGKKANTRGRKPTATTVANKTTAVSSSSSSSSSSSPAATSSSSSSAASSQHDDTTTANLRIASP